MGYETLDFVIPILFITAGILVFGTIFVLLGWSRVRSQRHSTDPSGFPKALSGLTASVCFVLTGLIVFVLLPAWIRNANSGHLIWLAFVIGGFLLNVTALIMSREANVARSAVAPGSIIGAAIYAAGFVWLLIATHGSPLSY